MKKTRKNRGQIVNQEVPSISKAEVSGKAFGPDNISVEVRT